MTHTPVQLCIFSKKKTKNPLSSVSSYETEIGSSLPQQKYIAVDVSLITNKDIKALVNWTTTKNLYFYGDVKNNDLFLEVINRAGYIPVYKTLSSACQAIEKDSLNNYRHDFFAHINQELPHALSMTALEDQLSHLIGQKINLIFDEAKKNSKTANQYILKHSYQGHEINLLIETKHPIDKTKEIWLYQFLEDWLQNEELNAILLQWRSIFNSLDEVCFITDESFQMLFKNKASEKLQRRLQLNDAAFVSEIFNSQSISKESAKPFKLQINYLDKDNFLKNCHLEIKAQKTFFNNKNYYAVIIKDITSVIQLQQQILDLSKFSDAGIVGSSIAHEINNPLGGLISYLQLMQMSQKEPELLKELNEILLSAEQCKQIAKKLLSFSRKTDPTQFSKIQIFEWANIFFQQKITEHPDIEWDINIINSETSILYEKEALETTFSGIIRNAIEAVSQNKGKKLIKVSFSETDKEVLIHFNDNGSGMDSSIQNQALNPFFTTKRERDNFGLGLTISYHLVRQSSGQLNFYSKPNVGTSVFLTFPRLDLNDQ